MNATQTAPVRTEPTRSAREQPGHTTIDPRVVVKIAARAASEVEAVGGSARRWLGVQLGSDEGSTRPQVEADVDGSLATVRIRLSVAYPAPLLDTTARVRKAVVERVRELAGVDVREVDITITTLHGDAAHARRVR